jgi:DNA-binding HxlR family transcriptional regulator
LKQIGRASERRLPRLSYQADPIRDSLNVLGRKWTLLVLRDIAFLKFRRFGEIRRNNPGLTARVLSRRLHQMREEGLLRRTESEDAVYYDLTKRGEDALYVLLALLRYGIRHHMNPKGILDQGKIMKELHYESPFGNRSNGK